jgi:hypothetical protein
MSNKTMKEYYLTLLANLKAFFAACESIRSGLVEQYEESLSVNVKETFKATLTKGFSGFCKTLDKKKVLDGVVDFARDQLSGIPFVSAAGSVLKLMLGTVVGANPGPALGKGADFMALAAAEQVGHLGGGGSEALLERIARKLAVSRWDDIVAQAEEYEKSAAQPSDKHSSMSNFFCKMVKRAQPFLTSSLEHLTGVEAELFNALVGERSQPPAAIAALADTTVITQGVLVGDFDKETESLEQFVMNIVFPPQPPPPPAPGDSLTSGGGINGAFVVARNDKDGSSGNSSKSLVENSDLGSWHLRKDLAGTKKQLEVTQKELHDTTQKLRAAENDIAFLKKAVGDLTRKQAKMSAVSSILKKTAPAR